MQKITVNFKSLKEKLLEVERDKMDLVNLRIVGGAIENGRAYPTFLHFEGISRDGAYKDYESIDASSVVELFYHT